MGLRLELQLDREGYSPGDAVKGSVAVVEGGGSRSLEVFLRYYEKTSSYTHVPVEVRGGTLHGGALRAGESYPFEIALPADALPGVTTANGELYWEVDAKSDEPGRDTHARRRVEVDVPRRANGGDWGAPDRD